MAGVYNSKDEMPPAERATYEKWEQEHKRRVKCIQCGMLPRTFPIRDVDHVLAFCSQGCAAMWALSHVLLGHHWCKSAMAWRPGALFCGDCAPSPAPEEGGPD